MKLQRFLTACGILVQEVGDMRVVARIAVDSIECSDFKLRRPVIKYVYLNMRLREHWSVVIVIKKTDWDLKTCLCQKTRNSPPNHLNILGL